MKLFTEVILLVFIHLCFSCTIHNDPDPPFLTEYLQSEGFFIVNEGNFMSGNGSISFWSKDSLKIYNDLFAKANARPLGDVPNSVTIIGERLFIVVNNSGKIEVVESNTMKSAGSITGLVSPRYILLINKNKAYVSSLFSTRIIVINPETLSITGHIETGRTSEAMVLHGDSAFIACWSGGNHLTVINTLTDLVVDSVRTGHEPESMAVDNQGRLWVLCSGKYTGEYFPELLAVNTSSLQIEKRFTFRSKQVYPSCLRINGTGDTLYYIERSIWRMPVSTDELPSLPFMKASGRLFYRIGVDPLDGRLYATNAIDYQQKGYLIFINMNGIATDSVKAGIIPGNICFKDSGR